MTSSTKVNRLQLNTDKTVLIWYITALH